jgi:hypothetical protein
MDKDHETEQFDDAELSRTLENLERRESRSVMRIVAFLAFVVGGAAYVTLTWSSSLEAQRETDSALRDRIGSLASRLLAVQADSDALFAELDEIASQSGHSALGTEVALIATRTKTASSGESRCSRAVIRERTSEALNHLLSEGGQKAGPEPEPYVCDFAPKLLEAGSAPVSLSVVGFDLDVATAAGGQIHARVVRFQGGTRKVVHEPPVKMESHARLEITLADIPALEAGQHVELVWDDDVLVDVEVSAKPPVIERITLRNTGHQPAHARGDQEFEGHGPRVEVTAELRLDNSGQNLLARVYMDAEEWKNGKAKSDHTRFQGWSPWHPVYERTDGKRMTKILTARSATWKYVDTNHHEDVKQMGDTGLVRRFTCTGDSRGRDHPQVQVVFNTIEVSVED